MRKGLPIWKKVPAFLVVGLLLATSSVKVATKQPILWSRMSQISPFETTVNPIFGFWSFCVVAIMTFSVCLPVHCECHSPVLVCMCICVCVFVCVLVLSLCMCVCVCMYVYVCVCTCECVCVNVLYKCPSVYLFCLWSPGQRVCRWCECFYLCVGVCVCVRKRERERERESSCVCTCYISVLVSICSDSCMNVCR